jgi:hypothetical protein
MNDQRLQQALSMARAGQRDEARKIVSQLVKEDPKNAQAWYLLSQLVEQDHQVVYCLEKVIQLQPANKQAQDRLAKLLNPLSVTSPAQVLPISSPPNSNAPAVPSSSLHNSTAIKTEKPKTSPWIWILLILAAPILACMCCGMLSSLGDGLTTLAPSEPAPQFSMIRQNMLEMTELEWNEYKGGLTGDTATWTGWVEEVQSPIGDSVEVWVDMDSPDDAFSVQDVTFSLPLSIGKNLRKDQRISFSGRIRNVINVLGSCQVTLIGVELK